MITKNMRWALITMHIRGEGENTIGVNKDTFKALQTKELVEKRGERFYLTDRGNAEAERQVILEAARIQITQAWAI